MKLTSLKLSDEVQYVSWNYKKKGEDGYENPAHLVKLENGKSEVRTTKEMLELGLAKRG